jgi:hypothetical protein
MSDVGNVFKKGCIIQLTIGVWYNRKRLTKEQVQKLAETHPEMVSGAKKLGGSETLDKLESKRAEAKSYVYSIALPFPVQGLVFIPKDLIEVAHFKLQSLENDFWELVEKFESEFAEYKTAAREVLEPDGLYNELDYPMDIRSKFHFTYRFIQLDLPGEKASLLSPEIYKAEKEKFVNMMEQARQQGIDALRTEFGKMVNDWATRKKFTDKGLDKFHTFFETFKSRNIFKDDDLLELVEKAQAVLNGKSVEVIRNDEDLKDSIKADMAKISEQVQKVFKKPRRSLSV